MSVSRLCLLALIALPVTVLSATPVTVTTVEMKQPVQQLLINGTVTADQTARLSASVSGLVSQLNVDIGDSVAPGAALVTLDSELNRLALQQAQASYRQQQASLNDTRRRLAEASRLKKTIAASDIRSLEAELQAAQASLAASQAEVSRQRALVTRHTVTAPFAGVISAKLTEVGEWVTPGSPVLELVGSDKLHADFAVPQRYFSQVSTSTPLSLRQENPGDADSKPVQAQITAIVPVSDPAARTFLLRASLPTQGLTPGMSIYGNLAIQSAEEQPVVPRDALLRDAQGNVSVLIVETVDQGWIARRKAIRIRPGQSDPVVVSDGLNQGERVIVRGNESLRDGDAVQVIE